MGHGDHVVADRVGPRLGAQPGDRLEDLEHLARHRLERVGIERGPGLGDQAAEQGEAGRLVERRVIRRVGPLAQHVGDRRGVDGGLLPDVEAGEREAEGAHEAQQVAQRPVGGILVPVADQRLPGELEVADELGLAAVGKLRSRSLDAVETGRDGGEALLQALADDEELAPVGLVLEALRPVAGEALAAGVVVGEALQEGLAGRAEADGVAEQADELVHALGVLAQYRLVLQPHRHPRGGGGDVGVAVAVTADPGAEADDLGQLEAVEVRVPVVGATDALLEAAVDLHHRVEQALVEEVEAVADLVADLGAGRAHLFGLPERLDQRPQLHRAPLALGEEAWPGVEVFGGGEDAPQQAEDHPPRRLGGVRGEHRLVATLHEHVAQLRQANSLLVDLAQGLVEGPAPELPASPGDATALPVLELLFGEVDELEVDAERADDRCEHFRRKAGDRLLETALPDLVGLPAEAHVAALEPLHHPVHLGPRLSAQDVAEQAVEQTDAAAQLAVAPQAFLDEGVGHGGIRAAAGVSRRLRGPARPRTAPRSVGRWLPSCSPGACR